MYHIIAIGITAILLYFISYLFSRFGYISLLFHNKIWNSILAAIFLITALAGIFLALQVTYKWNIPFIKTLLKIHVEAGIGMAFTGLIHFTHHLPYFRNLFTLPEKKNKERSKRTTLNARQISTNLFIIGFVSTSVQLLLLREMMNISGGYELIAGTFLCSWLLISAAGSSLAGKSGNTDFRILNLVFSFSPVISVFFLLLFSRLILNTGQTPSFLISVVFTLIVLLPFCLVSGFIFIKLISLARSDAAFSPGKSFSIETTGGIVSGIIISFLTAGLLNTYQVLLITFIIANTYVLITWYVLNKNKRFIISIISALLIILVISYNPDKFFRQLLLPGIKITETEDSPYGNITSGFYKGEKSKFYNQRLLSYKNDVIEKEENIQYALLQCNSTSRVMLISGSLESDITELSKYDIKEIIFIERDRALTKNYITPVVSKTANLSIVNEDAFRFLRDYPLKSDAIISSCAPPSTLLLNRFFTLDFFIEVKRKLTDDGVFVCSPGLYDNYMNNEALKLYSSIYKSLSQVFKNVIPLAGNKLYFIASDKELSTSICGLTVEKKINNSYVCSDFLSDDLIKTKSNEVTSLMDLTIKPNKLTHPVACLYYQSYNLSRHLNEKTIAIVIILVLFAAPGMAIKKRNLIMYFTASALAGFEILILVILQLIIGNMYQLTGLILAGIMAGLASGARADFKYLNLTSVKIKGIILIAIYMIFGLGLNLIFKVTGTIPAFIILLISAFLPAFFTGNIFSVLTASNSNNEEAASVYTADLAGSSLGLIAVSSFCIPVFGVQGSLLLLSILIFSGLLFGTVGNK